MSFSLHRRVYIDRETSTGYKKKLSEFASSDLEADRESEEFKRFNALHQRIRAAQCEAQNDLEMCHPCGHLVLPINLEEALIRAIHSEQLKRDLTPNRIYKLADKTTFSTAKEVGAKLEFISAVGKGGALPPKFTLNQTSLPKDFKEAISCEEDDVS